MSMLSAQCDELRQMAESVGLAMPQAATLMMGAADAIEGLESNNAKLREQLAKARDPQRIGGTADPESFVYAIEQLREFRWQHATNDEDAIPYINNVAAAHERENAKLRELVRWAARILTGIFPYVDYSRCTALEAVAAWKVEASKQGIEVDG